MGYSRKEDVEFYGQFTTNDFGASGYDYNASIQKSIADADGMIDDYCNMPKDFFTAGGIELQLEYLNGTDVAYLGGVTRFFNWYYGGTSHLKFKYHPVLSVTTLEEETSAGTWTARTEGTANDYIVVEDGVRYVLNTPAWKHRNVRVTYKAGYTTTPGNVSKVSGQLAATILQNIIDRKNRVSATAGAPNVGVSALLKDPVLSDEMKRSLQNYRHVIYAFT